MSRYPYEPTSIESDAQRRRRRFSRRVVNLDAEFSPINIKLNVPTNISTIHGLIKNMSTAGLFVELPMLYRVGTRFQVRVAVDGRIQAFYAIVWRVDLKPDDEKPAVYGHGMKITTAGEDTLNALMDYINALPA